VNLSIEKKLSLVWSYLEVLAAPLT